MALNVRDYSHAPLGLLTFYEGHLFQSVFGDSLVNLRVLCQLNIFTAILLAVGYFWLNTRDRLMTVALLLVCSVSSRLCFESLYDWNPASFPFVILSLILTLEYLKGRRSRNVVAVIGIVQALMVWTRLPLGIAVPIMFVLFSLSNDRRKAAQDSLIYFVAGISTTLFLFLLILGLPTDWSATFSLDNVLSGHGDISAYIRRLKYIRWELPRGASLLIALLVAQYIAKLKSTKWIVLSTLAVASVLLVFDAYEYDYISWIRNPDRSRNGYFMLSTIALFVAAYWTKRDSRLDKIMITAVALFTLIPSIGSDVIVVRPVWILVLPILMTFLQDSRKSSLIWLALTFCVMSMSCLGNLRRLNQTRTCVSQLPLISGLKHTNEHEQWLYEVGADLRSTGADVSDILIVGQGKYIVNYVYGSTAAFQQHFFHYFDRDDSDIVTPKLLGALDDYQCVMLCGCSWEQASQYANHQAAIKAAGFEEFIIRPTYIIYKRPSTAVP